MSFYTKNKEGTLLEAPIGKVETLLNNEVKIYSDKDLISELSLKVGKLQEQNKTLKEALEYYASVKNWKYATDSCLDRLEFNDNDGEFIMGEGHVYGKLAIEALAKVDE